MGDFGELMAKNIFVMKNMVMFSILASIVTISTGIYGFVTKGIKFQILQMQVFGLPATFEEVDISLPLIYLGIIILALVMYYVFRKKLWK